MVNSLELTNAKIIVKEKNSKSSKNFINFIYFIHFMKSIFLNI